MPGEYLKRILQAPVYDVADETATETASRLTKRLSNRVLLKREDLQPNFSFKLRGAYNKIHSLTVEERKRGVIAASAGNHAQGVALAAKELSIKATIIMPRTTPRIKVDAVRAYGAQVILFGDTYDEASQQAIKIQEERQLTPVRPYDDPYVIAGQGTIGMEILQQVRGELDAIFVPVGGGGLLAGVAAFVKAVRPEVKVIGVEPEEAACLHEAMKKGRRVVLPHVGIFADGVAVAQIGKEPFRVIKRTVDEVITASTDEICAAIKDIFEDTRSIAEPAGALAVAGMKKYIQDNNVQGQTFVAIVSGANINFDRLRYISERTDVGEQCEAILAVTIPERAGSFRKFCKAIGKRNVSEFNYRFSGNEQAQIFVGIKVDPRTDDRAQLMHQLKQKKYSVVDLTDNEMAKSHIRYMVGGRAKEVVNERLYRVEFPERPGALLHFLVELGERWNISLFHYRNHGAAYGRVLVGFQVDRSELKGFEHFMKASQFSWQDETDNEAYQLFLK